MAFSRLTQVNETIKRELAAILLEHFDAPKGQLISIIRVEVNPDLKTAKVYMSSLGSDLEGFKDLLRQLNKRRSFWQKMLTGRILMKFTPRLLFVIDDATQKERRIYDLLDSLDKE